LSCADTAIRLVIPQTAGTASGTGSYSGGGALDAVLLGFVEGLTELIPLSLTGHLILLGDFLGFAGPPSRGLPSAAVRRRPRLALDRAARRFVGNILLAFLPAAVVETLAHGFIKSVLFSSWAVSVSPVLDGIAILLIERRLPAPTKMEIGEIRPSSAFKVGLFQLLALVPGVSRSGATIMGALILGIDRRAPTEFSFFLAIPTMIGAASYDLWKNSGVLDSRDALVIGIGFVAAFLAALVVVRTLVAFVSRHGFAPFAWYRIGFGAVMLGLLLAQ